MDVSDCPTEVLSYTNAPSVAELYTATYNFVMSRPDVSELTVEDPAEAFEDLRDRNDLRMLLANERFMSEGFGAQGVTTSHGGGRVQKAKSRLRSAPKRASGDMKSRGKMGPPVDRAWSERWRKDLKIASVRNISRSFTNLLTNPARSDNSIGSWRCSSCCTLTPQMCRVRRHFDCKSKNGFTASTL